MFEAQMSHIMDPWIHYMHEKVHEILHKEFVQVLIYRERPKAATTYKDFKLSRRSYCFSECYDYSKRWRVHLMKQVESHLPSETILTVLYVLLEIWPAEVANTIIDTEIYDKAFE